MSKLQIISDKNMKSSKIKNLLLKKLDLISLKKKILSLLLGDGFMLQTLKGTKILTNIFMVLTLEIMVFL